MPGYTNLKANGLNTSPNSLMKPEGSLEVAKNVIIRRDNVIEPRRGFKTFGTSFPSASDRAKQLMVYKNRILRQYASTLQFDSNGSGSFSSFNGSYSETETGLRIRSLESNSNFYFTTSEGIKKLSAITASDFSTSPGFVENSGGIKAVDLTSTLKTTYGSTTGFLPQDSTVAYRVVWGTKDLNSNIILGTPSQRTEIYNEMIQLLLIDYSHLLDSLDRITDTTTTARIGNGDYVNTYKLPNTATAVDLSTKLLQLVSAIDNDIFLADDPGTAPLNIDTVASAGGLIPGSSYTITFLPGDPSTLVSKGDVIYVSGINAATINTLSGLHTVSDVTATTLTYSTTATGAVTFSTPEIHSGNFRNINVTNPMGTIDSPTPHSELVLIQNFISLIISNLKLEPITIITALNRSTYITSLTTTTSSNVSLTITIPSGVTTNYFYQVYRGDISQAIGVVVLDNLVPNDEMQLIYEAYTTITVGSITFTDITPDAFRGANLYTNEASGEGILQANDIPPFAKDINSFKGSTFFANCRTRYRSGLNLLGVSELITQYNAGKTPTLTISDGTTTNTYSFILGLKEKFSINFATGAITGAVLDRVGVVPGYYWSFSSANNVTNYYVWYKVDTETDPAIAGKTGIMVPIVAGYTSTQVAQATRDYISLYFKDFTCTSATTTLTVETTDYGGTTNASNGTVPGMVITLVTDGQGEDSTLKRVLLSSVVSPSIAVDETARSLVRIINKNITDIVYAYYVSGNNTVPGQMQIESRVLSTTPFYLQSNNATVGSNFNPDISPLLSITGITIANPTVITTSNPHSMVTGDKVFITDTNVTSTPTLNAIHTITRISANTFSVSINVTATASVTGAATRLVDAIAAENNSQVNRVYYSKYQQPEAVPQLNYYDVGARDKKILRIFPIRDSLFIFKEDGLYRISGEAIPFSLALFDSSCILLAPDSVAVLDNNIFCFTQKGLSTVSEAGVSTVSRAIDTEILRLPTFINFKTASWATSYESDNSYLFWTLKNSTDSVANICYRYSLLTRSWTTYDKSNTCGIINQLDDKLYLGAGDTNYIEQERKQFLRQDYADREYSVALTASNYTSNIIHFNSITNFEIGDVLEQTQTISVFTYNMLLKKLDLDSGPVYSDYYSTLATSAGLNIRLPIEALASKLDSDSGVSNKTFLPTNVDIVTDIIIINSHMYYTGMRLTLTSTGTLPAGLALATKYYVIKIDNNSFKLASTLNNANVPTPIDITDTGSGIHSVLSEDFTFLTETKTSTVSAIGVGTGVVEITTTNSHGLITGRYVTLTSTNSTPAINGQYVVTVTAHNKFTIATTVNIVGTSGTYVTDVDNYTDIQVCYNKIIERLNSNTGVVYTNYEPINYETKLEVVITAINSGAKNITINKAIDFIVGPMTLYKAISTEIIYSPVTGGDPQTLKHIGEATIMFQSRTFTSGTFSFSTDLLPAFIDVNFSANGNGIFGNGKFGEEWFGGEANAAPIRTLVPRDCQRHRFLNIKFEHSVARESYSIFGITLFGSVTSQRAYR